MSRLVPRDSVPPAVLDGMGMSYLLSEDLPIGSGLNALRGMSRAELSPPCSTKEDRDACALLYYRDVLPDI